MGGEDTLSGASRPAIRRSVVDFPVPEPPMMPTASPRRTLKEGREFNHSAARADEDEVDA